MAKTQIESPMLIETLPRGQNFTMLFAGTEFYNSARMGADIVLVDETGQTQEARVASRRIDALGNLTGYMGGSFAPMVGKPYDVVAVGDHLDTMFPDNPRASAINELYTMVSFEALPYAAPQQSPPTP